MDDIDRPIFIAGVDHSGTNILYRMLARHPDLAWFSQYSLRGGEISGRARVPFGGFVNRTGRRFLGFRWQKPGGGTAVRPLPAEAPGIWRKLVDPGEGFLDAGSYDEELAGRVRDAMKTDLAAWRRTRMLIGQPFLTRAVQLLDRIFPDALFIHVVRDGRVVALAGRQRVVRHGLEPPEALRKSANDWVESLAYMDRSAEALGERLLDLRYEDFCRDVHGWIRDVFGFCDLDAARISLEPVPPMLTPTNDKWLGSCSPEDRSILDDVLLPTLRQWGYETLRPSLDEERLKTARRFVPSESTARPAMQAPVPR